MDAVHRVLPRFFEELRRRVYPNYARLAGQKADYWYTGWTFATWQDSSDRDRQLTPCLLDWAREFHCEDETWILEGALQTLWLWQKYSKSRKSLDIVGFLPPVAGSIVIGEGEQCFEFRDDGWCPQLQKWATYKSQLLKKFQDATSAYEVRMRTLTESRGADPVPSRYSPANFEWFAMYQLGGVSTVGILKHQPKLSGDESTINKGIKTAAKLLQWKTMRKHPKGRKSGK